MQYKKQFFIVDDDPFNNKICTMIIKSVYTESEIITFTEPEKGLGYLRDKYSSSTDDLTTILLLDINMPTMSGWEFLEEYEKLSDEVKDHIAIFILSSSVDQGDIEKTKEYRCLDFISKPLSVTALKNALALVSPRPM